jgi:hypothetical protein
MEIWEKEQMDDRLDAPRIPWSANRVGERRDDLSALPAHRLLSGGPGPARPPSEASVLTEPTEPMSTAAPPGVVAGLPLRPPRKGEPRLHGADTCEQEAVQLQALAQTMERHLWVCSTHLEQARERYQQLRTLVGGTSAIRYELEHARLDMESYATAMIQIREDYLAFLRRAEQYLAAAALLRGAQRQDHE